MDKEALTLYSLLKIKFMKNLLFINHFHKNIQTIDKRFVAEQNGYNEQYTRRQQKKVHSLSVATNKILSNLVQA